VYFQILESPKKAPGSKWMTYEQVRKKQISRRSPIEVVGQSPRSQEELRGVTLL
jgi:hypothetical protein